MVRRWPAGSLAIGPERCAAVGVIVIHDDSDCEAADPSDLAPAPVVGAKSDLSSAEASGVGFQAKAASRLTEALQAGEAGRSLAEALAAAFVKTWGLTPEAAQRLRALLQACRSNSAFRSSVLERGTAGVAALVAEDPRCWADDSLKAKRAAWERAGLAEAAPGPQGGIERPCPECGGRAICETGSSAHFKLAKAYTHFRCIELHCGKQTHIAE
eukprot:TRINITY_DN66678_c0_g1_i1.p1 TRINITY_DN66678_c0_g1~~TRINITY_DN66678_c0_g1_i1.p1  ORF type:complete len:221 (-),score=47.91 TRINITY_DN66678_c0_g1_i1:88-729(-)